MEKPGRENGTLLLALIAGLSINGSFAALFSSVVPFSIFPLIALVLAVYCLHQRYLNRAMPDGMPKLAAACFLLGLLLYSAIVRANARTGGAVRPAFNHHHAGGRQFGRAIGAEPCGAAADDRNINVQQFHIRS